MIGRRPTPTALKRLAGNPGKRPLNAREPKPAVMLPACPGWLPAAAKKEYRRAGKLLVRLGVMTEADRAALAAYAVAWARWMEAEQAMAAPGFEMVAETDKGYQHTSPWLAVSSQAVKQMRAFLLEFGMTPASRSRVEAQEDEAEASLADLLFANVGVTDGD